MSETKHDQSNPIKILVKSSVHVNVPLILDVDKKESIFEQK